MLFGGRVLFYQHALKIAHCRCVLLVRVFMSSYCQINMTARALANN
jgi:hypothetical protein